VWGKPNTRATIWTRTSAQLPIRSSFFKDGNCSANIAVEYPIGHRRRRDEGIPELIKKFMVNFTRRFPTKQQDKILSVCIDRGALEQMPVHEFMEMFVI
jgi:2-methylcitrate dehydratase PrpD